MTQADKDAFALRVARLVVELHQAEILKPFVHWLRENEIDRVVIHEVID